MRRKAKTPALYAPGSSLLWLPQAVSRGVPQHIFAFVMCKIRSPLPSGYTIIAELLAACHL